MFLYRKKEINLLSEDFDKPNSSLSFIFGRREVGKTSLINEYAKDKEVLYLSAFETMSSLLIKKLKESIDTFFNIKTSEKIESFDELFNYLSLKKVENKIVIVFEDIQELLKIDKDFLVNLNNYWNKYLKNMNIQFIITSSVLPNNFESLQIARRVDNTIRLKSLSFNIIKEILPNISKDDEMKVFASFGTNPKYLNLYNSQMDFSHNLINSFLNHNSFLYNEGMNLIKKDLGDAVTYCSILYAISMGNKKIGDIAYFLNLKSSYLTRYMQKLVDLMIVNKITPINQNPLKSKFGRYEIDDNFLNFWFCYIYPNSNSINSSNYNNIYINIKKDFIKRLVSSSYKKYVAEIAEQDVEKFFDYTPKKVGSWWNNKDLEIDFIGYDSKTITFIDCKLNRNNNPENDYKELEKKAKNFDTQLEKKFIILHLESN